MLVWFLFSVFIDDTCGGADYQFSVNFECPDGITPPSPSVTSDDATVVSLLGQGLYSVSSDCSNEVDVGIQVEDQTIHVNITENNQEVSLYCNGK